MANEKRQKHVLYVEASDLVQASHGPAFEKLNCSLHQVSSAEAALEVLSSAEHFDLIIVGDVSKPVNDERPEPELSIITEARQRDSRVPILIFTSHNYLEQAYNAGATNHMLKPAGVIDLIEFVTPYLFRISKTEEPKRTDSGK